MAITKPKKDKRTQEEIDLDNLIEKLAKNADTADKAAEVQRLMKNREEIRKTKRVPIDPNTLISVGAGMALGLTQVAIMVKHEEFNTITSKALSFICKGRLR